MKKQAVSDRVRMIAAGLSVPGATEMGALTHPWDVPILRGYGYELCVGSDRSAGAPLVRGGGVDIDGGLLSKDDSVP